jgi:hypothetical protein
MMSKKIQTGDGLIERVTRCGMLCLFWMAGARVATVVAADPVGKIDATPGIGKWGKLSDPTGGPTKFINFVLQILVIAAGVALLFNIVMAGVTVVTGAAKPGQLAEAGTRILVSAAGLLIIVLAYVIVGFISKQLFGDSDFILDPKLTSNASEAWLVSVNQIAI